MFVATPWLPEFLAHRRYTVFSEWWMSGYVNSGRVVEGLEGGWGPGRLLKLFLWSECGIRGYVCPPGECEWRGAERTIIPACLRPQRPHSASQRGFHISENVYATKKFMRHNQDWTPLQSLSSTPPQPWEIVFFKHRQLGSGKELLLYPQQSTPRPGGHIPSSFQLEISFWVWQSFWGFCVLETFNSVLNLGLIGHYYVK